MSCSVVMEAFLESNPRYPMIFEARRSTIRTAMETPRPICDSATMGSGLKVAFCFTHAQPPVLKSPTANKPISVHFKDGIAGRDSHRRPEAVSNENIQEGLPGDAGMVPGSG